MRRLVLIVSIVAAVGLAVPPAGACTSTSTIKVTPKAIAFGTKAVGTDYFASVKITNSSGKPLRFLVEGGLPDDFGFGLYPGSTCPALTPGAILGPGQSCRAVVRFTPTEGFIGWEQTGSLVVTATDPVTGTARTALIPVSGLGK